MHSSRREYAAAAGEGHEATAAGTRRPPEEGEEGQSFVPPIPRPLPGDAAKTLAARARQVARLERYVRRGVRGFRHRLRREAQACAIESLYDWNARGVEYFNASRGWVFLVDEDRRVLYSLQDAAAFTPNWEQEIPLDSASSIIALVARTGEEYLSNDVSEDFRKGKPYLRISPHTQSELAVPLFDPDEDKVIGAYNLESDERGAFTEAQARELRRSAALLSVPLLVLRDLHHTAAKTEKPAAEGGWGWHPEVHGWSPGRIIERFCRAVVARLAMPGGTRPSCCVWYADPLTQLCWALGTCGYDYEFLHQCTLGPDSAVARTAASDARCVFRGTTEAMGFSCRAKARRVGVHRVVLTPLRAEGIEPFRGTLAIYGFEKDTVLPSDDLVRWLAKQAEDLVQTLHRQRAVFAKGHFRARLATSALIRPSSRLFRQALVNVLPHDATSIYVHETASAFPHRDEKGELERVYAAGFELPLLPKADKVPLEPPTREQKSISAYCAVHPGVPVRINFGEQDPIYQQPSHPPKPDPERFERLDVREAHERRRLGIGVPSAWSENVSLGVLRLYRSGKGRPFTDADGRLLQAIVASYHCCRSLFGNWHAVRNEGLVGPYVASPTPTLLEAVLRSAVDDFEKREWPVHQGSVFMRSQTASPPYPRFAFYSRTPRLPPEQVLAPLAEDLAGAEGWRHSEQIVTVPFPDRDGTEGERVCVPLRVWSGGFLVEVVCCLDFATPGAWDAETRYRVYRAGVEAAAMLAANRWQTPPPPGDDAQLVRAFESYATRLSVEKERGDNSERRARLLPAVLKEPAEVEGWVIAPEPSLERYGVRVRKDGRTCAVPLRLGPYLAAVLICPLAPGPAESLRSELRRRKSVGSERRSPAQGLKIESNALWTLGHLVWRVAGAWCRVVAPNIRSWWQVTFESEPVRDGAAKLWPVKMMFNGAPDLPCQ